MILLFTIYATGFALAFIVNMHGLTTTAWYWCILLSLIWPIDMLLTWGTVRYWEDHTKL